MRQTPLAQIKKTLSLYIPPEMISRLPDKWEKIGTVVTLRLPQELQQQQEVIGKVYAKVLGCTTVLNERGGISGVYREPAVEVIFGSPMTETIHTENDIRFRLDPQKIMFSSGNLAERKRMATIAKTNETVVDLFAGIGYFTIPMAVYSKPKKIFACEINQLAYTFLCKNIVLNHVSSIVEPLFGDNRTTAPKDCAERVILGFLKNPHLFLPVAFECLRNQCGVLHYHEVVPIEMIRVQPMSHIESVAEQYHRSVELLGIKKIKSYAPRMNHVVLDVRIGR